MRILWRSLPDDTVNAPAAEAWSEAQLLEDVEGSEEEGEEISEEGVGDVTD